MTTGRSVSAYGALDVLAMSPAQRVVFLYTQLMASLTRARRCLATDDVEGRSETLCRAQAIVQELLLSLNREVGGELGDRLAALYGYFAAEIIAVDSQRDPERLARLVTMVSPLLEAWEHAAQEVEPRRSEAASA
ncbi:MAG TPA: flagellar export chaperone FliS [Gemmatimonadales bacterium]|nr:flagellar export chaperone FliS [Gemmatimonadales bacterium]